MKFQILINGTVKDTLEASSALHACASAIEENVPPHEMEVFTGGYVSDGAFIRTENYRVDARVIRVGRAA